MSGQNKLTINQGNKSQVIVPVHTAYINNKYQFITIYIFTIEN